MDSVKETRSVLCPVRLSPALQVRAFVRIQKNDANDALAIYEAAFRSGIHFVSVKTRSSRISRRLEINVN